MSMSGTSGPGQSDVRGRSLWESVPPYFTGERLDEIGPTLLQGFVEQLTPATKTKRHYREVFDDFFEFCKTFDLYQSTYWNCPNPVSALPGYVEGKSGRYH
jgi:hypothetical protein